MVHRIETEAAPPFLHIPTSFFIIIEHIRVRHDVSLQSWRDAKIIINNGTLIQRLLYGLSLFITMENNIYIGYILQHLFLRFYPLYN